MVKLPRLVPAALLASLFAMGCAPQRVAVKPDFWQQRSTRVGVAVAPHPQGGAHKVGAQGLLDMAINSAAASDLQKHLQKFDLGPFDRLREDFAAELTKRGMATSVLPEYLDPATFPKLADENKDGKFEYDLRSLAQAKSLDAIVILTVRRYGTIRPYYGFIPLGSPKGFFEVTGQMVDLRTNALLWQTTIPEAEASVASAEPWDQPPDFPNLTAALGAAANGSATYLKREFFQVSPTP